MTGRCIELLTAETMATFLKIYKEKYQLYCDQVAEVKIENDVSCGQLLFSSASKFDPHVSFEVEWDDRYL